MKHLYLGLAAVEVVAFLAGPSRATDDLKGAYSLTQDGMKVTLTFDGDGAFTVKAKDELVVKGTYKLDKDQIEFTDKDGPAAITDKGSGKYKWALKDKKLTFTKVEDKADGRAEALTSGPWAAE